jgi:hypothetical protein
MARIDGSDVSATGDLSLEAKNIEITASMNSTESGSKTKGGQLSFNWSSSGSGSDSLNSFGINACNNYSEGRYNSTSHNNSNLRAGKYSLKAL